MKNKETNEIKIFLDFPRLEAFATLLTVCLWFFGLLLPYVSNSIGRILYGTSQNGGQRTLGLLKDALFF